MRTEEIKKKARNILGVPDDADMDMIRLAYRELAKKYHPDRNLDDKSFADEFILIVEAYKILCGEKNTRGYGIMKTNTDSINTPSFDDKSYWEWWMERFRDLY